MCTFIDPRFKLSFFYTEEQVMIRKNALIHIYEIFVKYPESVPQIDLPDYEIKTKRSKGLSSILEILLL